LSDKIVYSIECEIPGNLSKFIRYNSLTSLLDADIILFRPNISDLIGYADTYKGKPSLSDTRSFNLREKTDHWRRELLDAFNAGKTIFIILDELEEVYIDTGDRTYSGTGRNTRTTRIVAEFNNYKSVPIDLKFVNSNGSSMKLAEKSEIISFLWREISEISTYKVFIDGKVSRPLIYTKTGDKVVGALITAKTGSGAMILLPYIGLYNDRFLKPYVEDDGSNNDNSEEKESEDLEDIEDNEENEDRKGTKYAWSEEGISFGHRFVSILVEIDKTLKKDSQLTPTPEWAKIADYQLPKERKTREELILIESKLEEIQKEKEELRIKLASEGILRGLLFEKGKPLENAILNALKVLGFATSHYRDIESEFDVVFESNEGRLLGEAEGKDKKAINIDKLRQLEMNIHEDYAREDIKEMAKGVLFGNAYRLSEIRLRGEYFSEKCLVAVRRSGIALVRTPDLFPPAKYLSENDDKEYASLCRLAILNTQGGMVVFPEPPEIMADQPLEQEDNTK
jgi:hypothetical protein